MVLKDFDTNIRAGIIVFKNLEIYKSNKSFDNKVINIAEITQTNGKP